MSYLEEYNDMEKYIKTIPISKTNDIESKLKKQQTLALMHIAKCLSVMADTIVDEHEIYKQHFEEEEKCDG